MEISQLALLVLGCVCGCLGWFARECHSAVKELREKISDLHVLIATEFVRYDRLQDALKPLTEMLTEIKVSLHGKADK